MKTDWEKAKTALARGQLWRERKSELWQQIFKAQRENDKTVNIFALKQEVERAHRNSNAAYAKYRRIMENR